MTINNAKLILLNLALSALIFSSCQKEEELLTENTGLPATVAQQNADDDVCGTTAITDSGMQSRMAQMENTVQAYIAANPDLTSGSSRTTVTIPVVFHVVYNTAEQNISTAQIQSQVDALNEDFTATNSDAANIPSAFHSLMGNANIHFVLAARDPNGNATTGITRTSTSVTSFSNDGSVCFTSMGGHDAWPSGQYLNIWVCNKAGGAGYSTYPWSGNPATDGVMIRYNYVGRVGPFINNWNYQKGRTVTHEVGHWLGLIHIWGDAVCGNDLVGDTPPQGGSNSSCPTFPHVSSCSSSPNGDMYMNYMDYTNDNCRNMFSLMQVTRMLGYLNGIRASLLTSLGGVPPSATSTCNVPSGLTASSITSSSATLSWASTGALSYTIMYKPASSITWTTVSSSTTYYVATGLASSTSYQFQVQSVCSSGSSTFSSITSFTTTAPATVCNVPTGQGVSSVSASGATLSWASTGAMSYIVRYKATSSSLWLTTSTSGTYVSVSGLSASTLYEFQVQSVCSSGSSAYSPSAMFTTLAAPITACNVPSGLIAFSVTSDGATLTWTGTGANSYIVRYRQINTANWVTASSNTTSRVISGLNANRTYEFQVQSVCTYGSSAYSASYIFATLNNGHNN